MLSSARHVARRSLLRTAAVGGALLAASPWLVRLLARAQPSFGDARLIATTGWPPPGIITRQEWRADESIRKPGQAYDSTVQKLIVHHTVTPNSPPDPSATLRGVYEYHVSGEYIDIAYNFLIDERGGVYEGRWARDYPPDTVHNGELEDGRQIRGAHSLAHNSRTIGIAMLGTFSFASPPEVAVNALIEMLAWKCARWNINPLGASLYTNGNGETRALDNICSHRDVFATSCPGQPLWDRLPELRQRVANRLGVPFVGLATSSGTGYWIVSANGWTHSLGDAPRLGSFDGVPLARPIVGMASNAAGDGYWLVAGDGGVFSYGEAAFHGSTGGIKLNRPIVGMGSTPSGNGYWLVASDGGIFAFGDAGFHGSTGSITLNAPIVGMAPTPSGNGYWLVASDGGIFTYGDAVFSGSTGSIRLNRPIVGMACTPSGNGYWLVASDGGIFAFGDATFHGSTGSIRLSRPIVGMTRTASGLGYWLAASDGGVFAFGDAPFRGSAAVFAGP